ncbi:hypothetical protein A1O3_08085 [Capronia epimyces CBS 606.96]|uniref:Uncharacterized protein n=1 Tax=Capronia epimyces CBS 606.96 TaxID=1182542 RepID=W9XR42_9EURO|nr:uncharacterized protein A1O3_08085 [Capronia epimyces CBS 606.96]EXJ79800.1 hypothetical protein A1O3_08085 [Capronia epimyces CBS 606.96]
MAETVGVVAAALEFGKTVLELKQLYSSIKNAPEDLAELLEELDLFEEIMQTLAQQDALIASYAPPAVVQRCRQSCEKAVQSLRPVCSELSNSIKRCRWRGSVKVVLKDDVMEKARQRIERTRANLLLAQTASWNAMNTFHIEQHARIHALVLSTSTSLLAHPSSRRRDQPDPSASLPSSNEADSAESEISDRTVTLAVSETGSRRLKMKPQRRTLLTFQTLLLGKRIELVQERAGGPSTFIIRQYNIRPYSAPVFKYVKNGNIAALQQLFETKQASIFDRDEDGYTLIHRAVMFEKASMVRFLLRQGADPNQTQSRYVL